MKQNLFTEADLREAVRSIQRNPRFENPADSFGDVCSPIGDSTCLLSFRFRRYRDLKGREKTQPDGWMLTIRVESRRAITANTIDLGLGRFDGYPEIAEAIESFMPVLNPSDR